MELMFTTASRISIIFTGFTCVSAKLPGAIISNIWSGGLRTAEKSSSLLLACSIAPAYWFMCACCNASTSEGRGLSGCRAWCCDAVGGWVGPDRDWCGAPLDGWKAAGPLPNCCEWAVWNCSSEWVKSNRGCCCWGKCNGLYWGA